MPRTSKAERAGRAGDDILIIIKEDGDILVDKKVKQEVGNLLRSRALGQTLPRPPAVPLFRYALPHSPPVQQAMGYVQRTDPPHPESSRYAMNYILPNLFQAMLAGATASEQQRRNRRMMWLGLLLATGIAMCIYAFIILPSFGVGVPPSNSSQEGASWQRQSEPIPASRRTYPPWIIGMG